MFSKSYFDEFYCLCVGKEFVSNSSDKKNYHIEFSFDLCKAKKFRTLRTALEWFGFINAFCSPEYPLYLKRYVRCSPESFFVCFETIDVLFYI